MRRRSPADPARRFGGVVAVVAVALATIALAACAPEWKAEPALRVGPPALVSRDGERQVWVLTRQRERSVGQSRGSRRHHFDLRGLDTRTAQPAWTRRLLTIDDDGAGTNATARILGQDGNTVWLFIADQPVAVSADDGHVLGGRDWVETTHAALRGVLPASLDAYAFDEGLVVTAADGRRLVLRGDAAAATYLPRSDDHFRAITFAATQWNGGHRTTEFLVRHGTVDGRWLGLYTDREAADARNDSWGDKLKDASRVTFDSEPVRRSLRRATFGRSSDGKPRLADLSATRPGEPDWLSAGFLVKAGTREPLPLDDPPGTIVVHRTRSDDAGRLVMSRLDGDGRTRWTANLPFSELQNRWQMADRLLLFGSAPRTVTADTSWPQEGFAVLYLRDGKVSSGSLPNGNEPAQAAGSTR